MLIGRVTVSPLEQVATRVVAPVFALTGMFRLGLKLPFNPVVVDEPRFVMTPVLLRSEKVTLPPEGQEPAGLNELPPWTGEPVRVKFPMLAACTAGATKITIANTSKPASALDLII
jgi:hypothetical protein